MPEPFEIHAELDEGFTLPESGTNGNAEPWQGVRVRYRLLGSRGKWRTFLLSFDRQPTIEELQHICATHEETYAR